ncbi:hypothetical protein AKJ09_06331 [Labilithrix luteola]|uniref:Type IV fimbrial biogenesis protein PilY1 n=1 Tax=Labilithrix luteola TaxID=1391654 RepID=A0A0K1Q1P3_9BACT|nr:hypothetical protein AKJ09_06331 [Labilithrix luteola]
MPMVFVACASEDRTVAPPNDAATALPSSDASVEAAPDAPSPPCDDCAYFPDACTADVLCQSGPFVADAPGGTIDSRTRMNVVRGRSATDVWAAGALGAMAHFDGASWKVSDVGVPSSIFALWLRDSGEVAIAAMTTLYLHGLAGGADASAGGWTTPDAPSTPSDYRGASMTLMSTFAAPGAEWMWCATRSEDADPAMRTSGLWRLRRTADGNFEIGVGIAPATCRFTYPCSQMTSVHGLTPNELWAVGSSGAAIHLVDADGEIPTAEPFNTQTMNALNGVWVAPNGEVWAVGAQGTIRHHHGDSRVWDVVADVPTSVDLNAVWGTSTSDIWAVGSKGVVLHYDGAGWSRVAVAGLGQRRPNLTSVWTASPGRVWVAGQGVLLSVGGHS